MKLPVRAGEKYAVIALDAGAEIRDPLDLGLGFFALPRGTFELPDHWKEWLGSLKVESIERSGLMLLAKGSTKTPSVLDADNEHLLRRVSNLYWGLLGSGRVRIEGSGSQLTGACANDEVDVRQVGTLNPVFPMPGMLTTRITEGHLRRAADLATNLTDLFRVPGMFRMRLAMRTFLLAFAEDNLGERIHQFVRTIDGLTRVRRGKQFDARCTLFAGSEAKNVYFEIYTIRSNVEHFQDPVLDLPRLPTREDLIRGVERAHQAEALARYCVTHLVENRELWPYFTDDHVEEFWSKPDEERVQIWGKPVDLTASLTGFDPRYVPDER